MKTASISVRLDEELLGKIRQYRINISEVVRAAMHSEVEKAKRQQIKDNLENASKTVKRMSMGQIVRDIREMRDSR